MPAKDKVYKLMQKEIEEHHTVLKRAGKKHHLNQAKHQHGLVLTCTRSINMVLRKGRAACT